MDKQKVLLRPHYRKTSLAPTPLTEEKPFVGPNNEVIMHYKGNKVCWDGGVACPKDVTRRWADETGTAR